MEFILTIPDLIRFFLFSCSICILIAGLLILLKYKDNSASRNILLVTILCWLLSFSIVGLFILVEGDNGRIFPAEFLFVSFLSGIVGSVYPIETIKPKTLRGKTLFVFISPFVFISLVGLGWHFSTSLGFTSFYTWDVLFSKKEFIITFIIRLLISIVTIFYTYYPLYLIYKLIPLYNKYTEENYSDNIAYNLKWVQYYAIINIFLGIVFLINNIYTTVCTQIIYLGSASILWGYLIRNALIFKPLDHPEEFDVQWSLRRGWFLSDRDSPDNKSPLYYFKNKEEINYWIRYIVEWIEVDKPYLNNNFRVQDIMDKTGLSRQQVGYLLKAKYGINFLNVVQSYRIKEAQQMLRSSQMSIKEVAFTVGFSSPAVFSRSFIQITGLTPQQYKISNR